MATIKETMESCRKVGLTYDGVCIGLPEEYYKENYPKEYLDGLIRKKLNELCENDSTFDISEQKLLERFTFKD